MVSLKHLLALLPLAIATMAAPQPVAEALNTLQERRCVPPSNCGAAVGSCEYCCGSGEFQVYELHLSQALTLYLLMCRDQAQ
jgi:hypothetical protein